MVNRIKKLFKKKLFWLFLGVISLFLLARYSGLMDYFTVENIRYQKDLIEDFIVRHYWTSVFIFWLIYVMENVLALPIAAWLTLAAGFFYGVFPAIIFTVISATSGALVSFVMARYLFGNQLQGRYKERLIKFNKAFKQYGVSFLLGLRFIPIIPFALINIFAGLTLVPISLFAWTTALGMVPVTTIYALAGKQFQTIDSPRDVFSWQIAAILMVLVLLALVHIAIKKYHSKKIL